MDIKWEKLCAPQKFLGMSKPLISGEHSTMNSTPMHNLSHDHKKRAQQVLQQSISSAKYEKRQKHTLLLHIA